MQWKLSKSSKLKVSHDRILQLYMLKTEFAKEAKFWSKKKLKMKESYQEENERQSEVLVGYQH